MKYSPFRLSEFVLHVQIAMIISYCGQQELNLYFFGEIFLTWDCFLRENFEMFSLYFIPYRLKPVDEDKWVLIGKSKIIQHNYFLLFAVHEKRDVKQITVYCSDKQFTQNHSCFNYMFKERAEMWISSEQGRYE